MVTNYYELAMGFSTKKPETISSESINDLEYNAYEVTKSFESIESMNTMMLINENNTSQKIRMLNKISKMYNQNTITNRSASFGLESFYDKQFSLEDEKQKSFKEIMKKVWDGIKTFFIKLFQGIMKVLKDIGNFFKSLFAKDVSEQEIQEIEQTTDDKKIENNFKQAVSKFSGAISGVIASVKDNVNKAKDSRAEREADKAFYDKATYAEIPDISRLDPNKPIKYYDTLQNEITTVYNNLSDVLNNKVNLQDIVNKFDKQYTAKLKESNDKESTEFRMIGAFGDYVETLGIKDIDIKSLNHKQFAKIYSKSNFKILERMCNVMTQRVSNLQKIVDKALVEVSKRIQADDEAQKKADDELATKREQENADRVAKGQKPIDYSKQPKPAPKTTAPQTLQKFFMAKGKDIQALSKFNIAILKLIKPLIGIKLETWKKENYGKDHAANTIDALK